jgi:hypothetical protein
MKKPVKPRAKPAGKPAKAASKGAVKKRPAEKLPAKPAKKPVTKASTPAAEPTKVRIKLVRDSFTMPREDFERIARMKSRAIDLKRPAKKSELLRAGLQVLERLDDTSLLAVLNDLRPIKTGRPKKRH